MPQAARHVGCKCRSGSARVGVCFPTQWTRPAAPLSASRTGRFLGRRLACEVTPMHIAHAREGGGRICAGAAVLSVGRHVTGSIGPTAIMKRVPGEQLVHVLGPPAHSRPPFILILHSSVFHSAPPPPDTGARRILAPACCPSASPAACLPPPSAHTPAPLADIF